MALWGGLQGCLLAHWKNSFAKWTLTVLGDVYSALSRKFSLLTSTVSLILVIAPHPFFFFFGHSIKVFIRIL